jgi:hypothetical protein
VQAGLSYYQERVEALNDALHKLDDLDEEADLELETEPERGRAKTRGKASRGAAAKPAKRGRQPKSASRLPSTGGDFFPDLLSEQKRTASELLKGAMAKLPFKPNAQEKTQLRSRMIAALAAMQKAGKIGSEGKGRQRTYFTA